MGSSLRNKKAQPLVSYPKNDRTLIFRIFFHLPILAIVFVTSTLVGCGHSGKKSELKNGNGPNAPTYRKSEKYGTQLTFQGQNLSGQFSPDAQRFLFVAKNRNSHRHPQIYEMNISTLEERRITFQDGECFDPAYTGDGRGLVYSSTTDEIKERPKLFYKNTDPEFLPTELYTSDISGNKIERWTEEADADRSPIMMDPQSNRWAFLSRKNGKYEVWGFARPNPNPFLLFQSKHSSISIASFSFPLELWAWVQEDLKDKSQTLFVGDRRFQNAQEHRVQMKRINSLRWASSSQALIISGTNEKNKSTILVYYHLRNCTDKLLESDTPIISVDISRDENQLLLAVEQDNSWNIFLKDINLAAGECANSQTPASKSSPVDRDPR